MKLYKPKIEEIKTYIKLETTFFKHHKPYKTLLQDVPTGKRNLMKEFEDLLKERNAFFRFVAVNGEIADYIYGKIMLVGANEKNWKKKGDLNSVVVLPTFRGKGIAQFMTNKFMKWLKLKKIKYVEMSVNVRNKEMLKFANKLGFKEQHIKFGKIIL